MFSHHTVLLLRTQMPEDEPEFPIYGHFRDYHFVRNVMEVKRHLLRCLRQRNPAVAATPDIILVDAGPSNADIKSELERWIEKHQRLRRIKVVLPQPRPRIVRVCARAISIFRRCLGGAFAPITAPVQ